MPCSLSFVFSLSYHASSGRCGRSEHQPVQHRHQEMHRLWWPNAWSLERGLTPGVWCTWGQLQQGDSSGRGAARGGARLQPHLDRPVPSEEHADRLPVSWGRSRSSRRCCGIDVRLIAGRCTDSKRESSTVPVSSRSRGSPQARPRAPAIVVSLARTRHQHCGHDHYYKTKIL